MKEQSWIIGAVAFGLVLALWLGFDYRRKHPRAERGDPFAEWDRPARPVGPVAGFRGAPRFTDRMGRPRLPTAAEITSELQALSDPEPPPVRRPVILEPTVVHAPRVVGPEPGEWSYWAGRWWAPTSLEDRLPARDWLPGQESEPDWLKVLLGAA